MCINCIKDTVDEIFVIKGRGYGSKFDLENIKLPLCKNCIDKLNLKSKWFENVTDANEYLYEDELENLINQIGVDKVSLTNICSSSIIKLQNKNAR